VYAPDGTILETTQPGYGYYDEELGRPISRNETVLPFHGLSNWSKIVPGLYIGQGHDSIAPPGAGGVILWDDVAQVHRRLDTGNCSDINTHVDGQTVAISYMRAGEGAIIQRGTLADVYALERYTPTTTIPDPQEPPVPTFSNHLDVVQRERAKYGPTIGDTEAFLITNAVALDPAVKAEGWGLCKAPAGGHGVLMNGQNYRVDKLCHPQGFINDILGSSGTGAATAQWGPTADANGNPSNWAPAFGDVVTPPPPGTTHKYIGGGNDTGTCDVCGMSRFDPVHAIPESTVAHAYDGGEQDTGLCDVCQKPKMDALHGGIVTPPPPDGDQAAAIQKLRTDLMLTQMRLGEARADHQQLREDFDALREAVVTLSEKVEQGQTGLPKLRAKGELTLTFARKQQIDIPVVPVPEP
jgi:hypothetical protein